MGSGVRGVGEGRRCQRSVCCDRFVASSTGTNDGVFDLATYICEANVVTGVAINPADVSTVNLRAKRQSTTPVALERILSTVDGYGRKLTQWCKRGKPNLPWMANLTVPGGGSEASTSLPSGRHANIGAFVSHTETETKDMKLQVATQSTQLVATQKAVQDLANMLKPVLSQLVTEVRDIKVGVGHRQAGLMALRADHDQMRAALASQGFHLPPAGSAAASAAPLPALPDAEMTTSRDAGPLPSGGASAASAAHPGGWRQVLLNAMFAEPRASIAGATAGVPLGLGNAHDQQAAAGAALQLPRPKTGGAPPCDEHCDGADDDEYGALWAPGLPLTRPGRPALCGNVDRCDQAQRFQSGGFGYCCGHCFEAYATEHSEHCGWYPPETVPPAVPRRSRLARFSGALSTAVGSSTKAALGAPPVGAPPSQETNDGAGDSLTGAGHCGIADDDELGALCASGPPPTGPGPPKLCRNVAIYQVWPANSRPALVR